jgi:hypothetical protein
MHRTEQAHTRETEMTIAINSQDFRSSTPFDPERWRRTYARRSHGPVQTVRPRRTPRREFDYQNSVRQYVPSADAYRSQSAAESSANLLTLLVAALLTALVVVGLVALADFASGGGTPGGINVATAVGTGESVR